MRGGRWARPALFLRGTAAPDCDWKKNGKRYRYGSVVESRLCRNGRPARRQVLYRGEVNSPAGQEAVRRKTIAVFDERKRPYEPHSLFPLDRFISSDGVNALSVVLTEMRLRRPRG